MRRRGLNLTEIQDTVKMFRDMAAQLDANAADAGSDARIHRFQGAASAMRKAASILAKRTGLEGTTPDETEERTA